MDTNGCSAGEAGNTARSVVCVYCVTGRITDMTATVVPTETHQYHGQHLMSLTKSDQETKV